MLYEAVQRGWPASAVVEASETGLSYRPARARAARGSACRGHAQAFGSSRLDAAITFVETKNGGPLKGRTPIDFATLRFPVKGGRKKLADATVEELSAAIATLKGVTHTSTKARLKRPRSTACW